MNDIAISVKNLSKKYHLYDSPRHRLKEALHPFREKYHKDFWALKDISFEIKKGESLGIIGKNGSGKSTLLKIIAGVLTPTAGAVSINGNVSALLELGTGFNPDYTGMENIYLSGSIMGHSREEMAARIDDILAFADIGDFVHQPVKTYSSGMFVRLAFAVAVSSRADILIVDEALSVGDIFFQQKCFSKMREIIDAGATCIFVSHSAGAVRYLCDRVILMERGAAVFDGAPEAAVSRYNASMQSPRVSTAPVNVFDGPTVREGCAPEALRDEILANNILTSARHRHGDRWIELIAACVQNKNNEFTMLVGMMEPLTFHMLLVARRDVAEPRAGFRLTDRLGNMVFAAGTSHIGYRLSDMRIGQELIVRFDIDFTVSPGDYSFALGCSIPAHEKHGPNAGFTLDQHEMLGPITVTADYSTMLPFYGVAKLPMQVKSWHLKR